MTDGQRMPGSPRAEPADGDEELDGDDELDGTVVIARHVEAAAPEEDEGTVVIERPAASPLVDDPDEDGTVVIERADAGDDERTVVVERPVPGASDDPDDRTVVVERTDAVDGIDSTVVVDRPSSAAAVRPSRGAATARPPGRARRIRIALPDGVAPSPRAVEGAGAGATERYAPREIPPLPVAPQEEPVSAEATRAPAPGMPSVGRASRRTGRVVVGVAILACVVSVVGLVAIVVAIVTG